jgi:hypothetical protein
MLSACSVSNNDVGSIQHDGSATGGVAGNAIATGGVLGSGGATGGVLGSGGASTPLFCTYEGKTYAAGDSFKVDCNTCTCGAFGDNVVRCTVMACSATGGSPAGTGGLSGSGGVVGTGGGAGGGAGGTTQVGDGGDGRTCVYDGKTYPYGATFPSVDGCNECYCIGPTSTMCSGIVCDAGAGKADGFVGQSCTYNGKTYPEGTFWYATDGCNECYCLPGLSGCNAGGCPDGGLQASCYYDKAYPLGVTFPSTDGCNICECAFYWYRTKNPPEAIHVACTLWDCSAPPVRDAGSASDASVDACAYNGTTYPLDSYFYSADGCNHCHCRTDGQVTCTLNTCTRDAGAPDGERLDIPMAADIPQTEGGAFVTPDVAVMVSACSDCGSDELCVGYYDGTCKAMYTSCNKVSVATRISILLNHERCFSSPMGDEICGTRDGQHFWGCGEPPCPAEKETLVSDINCYGP